MDGVEIWTDEIQRQCLDSDRIRSKIGFFAIDVSFVDLNIFLTGLLTAIHKDHFKVVNYRELLFNDFGDRVAQLLHVKSVIPFPLNGKQDIQQEVIIVNTHLLFPHDSSLSIVRLHQVGHPSHHFSF